MAKLWIAVVFGTIGILASVASSQLSVGFYEKQCPQVEAVVQSFVQDAITRKPGVGAGLLRLQFHDCFVQGCDASVLIDSTKNNSAEKDAPPNISLRGFEVIDAAKAALETQCPGVVSCADIVAYAARDSVFKALFFPHLFQIKLTSCFSFLSQLGGPFWEVPVGRRDGTISRMKEANASLPAPFFNVAQLTQNFAAQGLSQDDMIVLSGAHTIGIAHCFTFSPRLYNFSANASTDPTLDPNFATALKKQCPPGKAAAFNSVVLDSHTPIHFDNSYYVNLALQKGVLGSDQVLFSDAATSKAIKTSSVDEESWRAKFAAAMIKMGSVKVKTGQQGEIRKSCRAVNHS
ncbi:peroxidase 5 isoform X1 [Selaginella moellendorffii]|uniref:peroxidase 5 isoform X1 n=1 Tax=Selaginella moellendorffii TaxID=88036 RepID=UPI000D1CA125|nr:peroxidase 5 isoform X1 [Selaginella moellendorffii]|eukprot:XP_024524040.1 peroxidase 5 isoform X1 [Selaginella moellendorffii]